MSLNAFLDRCRDPNHTAIAKFDEFVAVNLSSARHLAAKSVSDLINIDKALYPDRDELVPDVLSCAELC
jgi:hypothetical protein